MSVDVSLCILGVGYFVVDAMSTCARALWAIRDELKANREAGGR